MFQGLIVQQKDRYERLITVSYETYDKFKHLDGSKEFSMAVKHDCPKYLQSLMWKVFRISIFSFHSDEILHWSYFDLIAF